MNVRVVNDIPNGAYILDCRPIGWAKILRVDPSTLTQEERIRICKGVSTFSTKILDLEHPEYQLMHIEGDDYEIVPRNSPLD